MSKVNIYDNEINENLDQTMHIIQVNHLKIKHF